jgi:hypothetical protein
MIIIPPKPLTIHFIGGPLTLELPPQMHHRVRGFYEPFLTDGPARLTLTFEVGPAVEYSTTRGMRIAYPETGDGRTALEPRFELIPTERGARVRYRMTAFQGVDCVLRIWATMLHLPPGGFLYHAAGIVTPEGRGHLLCGRSGSGKSTFAGNLIADPRWHVLSDEMPAVLRGKGGWSVSFTPFWGDLEPRMPERTEADLVGICKLEQGDSVKLEPLDRRAGTELLLQSVVSYEPPPWFADLALPFATELARGMPIHRLTVPRVFDPDELGEALGRGVEKGG